MALNVCSQKGIFSHKKACCYIQIILVFRIICVIKCWSTLKLHITDLSFSWTHAVRLCWRHVSIKKRAGVYIQLQLWWSVVTPCSQERASGLKTHRLPFDFQLYLKKKFKCTTACAFTFGIPLWILPPHWQWNWTRLQHMEYKIIQINPCCEVHFLLLVMAAPSLQFLLKCWRSHSNPNKLLLRNYVQSLATRMQKCSFALNKQYRLWLDTDFI